MEDIDDMENLWSKGINECLDLVAPWKLRKIKPKRYCLSKEVQKLIKVRKGLETKFQAKLQDGKRDSELEKKLKKHRNYCNKRIKKEVTEKAGRNITNTSSIKEIWNSINDILRPDTLSRNRIKIQTKEKVIEDPFELAELFNEFFKEKVEKLASGIEKKQNSDPFSRLREKLHGRNLNFKLKTVNEQVIFKILQSLRPKKSYGFDGISA